MNIGQKIKTLRKARKIQQKELALKLGLGQATVSNWERGRNEPDSSNRKMIAAFFGIKESDLFLGIDPNLMLHALGAKIKRQPSSLLEKYANEAMSSDIPGAMPVEDIPMIEWKDLSSLPHKEGEVMLYQTKIINDEMQDEFKKGETIHFQTSEKPADGKYVIASGPSGDVILRLYRKYGSQIILRALNPDFPEIPVNRDNPYKIIGVVKRAMHIREY